MLESLEKKLPKHEDLKRKHHSTINQYKEQIYATRISSDTPTLVEPLINYILGHTVVNQNKPDKLSAVYDAAAKCNNLVSILTCFTEQFQKQVTSFYKNKQT